MFNQKSFENELATLYLVSTPIGNMDEMSFRAVEVLKTVDVIACEDTRLTMKLLSHYDIETQVISHHAHNEEQSVRGILKLLESGKAPWTKWTCQVPNYEYRKKMERA